MTTITTTTVGIEPIFISIKEAANALCLSSWDVYKMCDAGLIDARYQGCRRLVVVESLRRYAANLPTVQEVTA